MKRLKLQPSPIQLRMKNLHKIIPMGKLQGFSTDIDGARVFIEFEVIEMIDDNNMYHVLLGFGQAYEMDAIINLKKSVIFQNQHVANWNIDFFLSHLGDK